MKNIILALSFFALLFATQTVEAQSQNIYRYSFEVDSLPDNEFQYIEVPARLLSLWTLGGSFNVTNLGAGADDFAVTVYGTSDETATTASGDFSKWQLIKQVSISALAAGATSYQHFRAANEMFYLGHTKLMIGLATSGDQPGAFEGMLVLKKQ
jgi:hypothetical protein